MASTEAVSTNGDDDKKNGEKGESNCDAAESDALEKQIIRQVEVSILKLFIDFEVHSRVLRVHVNKNDPVLGYFSLRWPVVNPLLLTPLTD